MNEMQVTKKQILLKSWWVPFALLAGPFNFLFFSYAGFSSKDKKLVYISYIYALPLFFQGCNLGEIAFFLLPIGCIAGSIHAVCISKSYAMRCFELKAKQANSMKMKNMLASEKTKHTEDTNNEFVDKIMVEEAFGEKIGLNYCSAEALVRLPFITEILAKKAIQEREKKGGFIDIQDFGMSLGLKPHMIEKIRPLVTIEEVVQSVDSLENGRVLDL